jgi:predicted ribonuclease YlaK
MVEADEVQVVIPSVVLYEIEKHKDAIPKEGVRKRALYAGSRLEELGAEMAGGVPLADGATVRVLLDSAPPERYANEVLAKGGASTTESSPR